MDSDDLGELGESELRKLAAQGDLVLNPARRDRTGFDGLLELKAAAASAPAADLVPTAFRAFIQVKTTRRPCNISGSHPTGQRVSIKLSNWQRMVSDTAPWFIFVVHVDEDDAAHEAFLVHVDDARTEEAMKALRHVDGDLHKTRLSTSYGEEHRLDVLHGSALRQRLFDTIGSDVFAYQQRKHAHYKSCGYDDNPWRAQFQFDATGEDLVRKWEEMFLGSPQSIDFRKVVVEDVRFGRAVVRSDLPEGGGTLKISPRPVLGTVYVESADRLDWVSVPAEIYSTVNVPVIPSDQAKVRIKAGPLSLTMPMTPQWDDGEAPLSGGIVLDETTPCRVGALASAARALLLLTKSKGATVYISFQSKPGERLKLLRSNSETPSVERLAELEEWIAAGQVAARYGLEDLEIAPLSVLERYPGLTFLQAVLGNSLRDLEFSIDVDGPEVKGERAVIMCPAARLGDKVLVACVAMFGVPQPVGDRLVFKPERAHVEDVAVVGLPDLDTVPLGTTVAKLGGAILEQLGPQRVIYPRHSNGLMFLGPELPQDAR